MSDETADQFIDPAIPHRRRPRYSGKYPRKFEDKYKERGANADRETIDKVMAAGKTPAGTHRPILVAEILEILQPKSGEMMVDCTLGYGGHAREILDRLIPGGHLFGLDADPIELPKTEARLRALGFGSETFTAHRSNYAGLPKVLAAAGIHSVHGILADLGVSSMQLDDPARGFSTKFEGPLDLRMNPTRGITAAQYLAKVRAEPLIEALSENSDEPFAEVLGPALASRVFNTTAELAQKVRSVLPAKLDPEERDLSVRRVFQALRIAVNEEFTALDSLLRHLPQCLAPGGRFAVLTFHSGEDRRVKKALQAGYKSGIYAEVAHEIIRAGADERRANPRSTSAKLRWAIRA